MIILYFWDHVKKSKMNENPPSLFHKHLLNCKLFEEDWDQYVITLFDTTTFLPELIKIFIGESDGSTQKPFPFDDMNNAMWMLNVTSYLIYKCSILPKDSTNSELLPIIHIILMNIYRQFILKPVEANNDIQMFIEISIQMIKHSSMLATPNTCDKSQTVLKKFFKEIITGAATLKPEVLKALFKVILGLCDYSMIMKWEESRSFLLSCLFRVLVFTTKFDSEMWSLFNEYSAKWPESNDFGESWHSTFERVILALSRKPCSLRISMMRPFDSKSLENEFDSVTLSNILLQMMDSARVLGKSPNYKVIHRAFDTITSHVSSGSLNKAEYFSRRWQADEIFEMFGLWPLSGPSHVEGYDPRKTSIASFVLLLDQGAVKEDSPWFKEAISYFVSELENPDSTLTLVLMPLLGKLIISHPIQTHDMIVPIIKCCQKQSEHKTFEMCDPDIMCLILAICEIFQQEYGVVGTIRPVKKLLKYLYPTYQDNMAPEQQTWHLHVLTLMACGAPKQTRNDLQHYASLKNPPPELFVYIMFLPELFPAFLKTSECESFIRGLVETPCVSSVFSDDLTSFAFSVMISELACRTAHLQPLSSEKDFLFKLLLELNLTDVTDSIQLSSFPRAHSISPKVAQKLEESGNKAKHFALNNCLVSFIERKRSLIVIARHIYGCLCFEVDDIMLQSEEITLSIKDVKPQTVQEPKHSSSLMDRAFEDKSLLKCLEPLLKSTPITFEPYSSLAPPRMFPRVFSFLAMTGLVRSPDNESSLRSINTSEALPVKEQYDRIPHKIIIEVLVLEYTPLQTSGLGSMEPTSTFIEFLSLLGTPADYQSEKYGLVRAYIYDLPMLTIAYIAACDTEDPILLDNILIFNETGGNPSSESFCKSMTFGNARLIYSAKSVTPKPINDKKAALSVSLIKGNKSVAFPAYLKYPRLVASENASHVIALFAAVEGFTNQTKRLSDLSKARKQALAPILDRPPNIVDIMSLPFSASQK